MISITNISRLCNAVAITQKRQRILYTDLNANLTVWMALIIVAWAPLPASLKQAEVPHGRRHREHHHHDQQPGAQRLVHGTVELKSV